MLSRNCLWKCLYKKVWKSLSALWNWNYPTFSACSFLSCSVFLIWRRLNKTSKPTQQKQETKTMLSSNASDSDSDSELKNIIFTLGASSNPLAQKYAAKVQKKLSKKIFFFLLFFWNSYILLLNFVPQKFYCLWELSSHDRKCNINRKLSCPLLMCSVFCRGVHVNWYWQIIWDTTPQYVGGTKWLTSTHLGGGWEGGRRVITCL